MVKQFPSYRECLDFFKRITYKTNEYQLKMTGNPKKIMTRQLHTFAEEQLVVSEERLDGENGRTIVKKEAVDRFSPNNIDNKDFWVLSRKLFPYITICGAVSKNIKEVNRQNLGMSESTGILPFLNRLIETSQDKLNVLEIGFGYGSLFLEIKDKSNYVGIDYIIPKSLKRYKNLIEINESGIPFDLMEKNRGQIDVVYSVNVLQHCSQRDRFIYLKQASEILKSGGYLLFTMFLMTKNNKDSVCWGYVDENGRGYTHFFNQLTECDYDYELRYVLDVLGFEIIQSGIAENFYVGIVRKK